MPTVEELVAQNLKKFKKERAKECFTGVLKEANRLVDSTLLANAKNKKVFSVIKPPIPDKPVKPDPLPPIDSAEVKPILDLTSAEENSLVVDSIEQATEELMDAERLPKLDSIPPKQKGDDF
ncbi:MAG: hypothetical protein AB8G15_00325 [Saprospiraceae bacterium]